jgi:type II secretion system protein N
MRAFNKRTLLTVGAYAVFFVCCFLIFAHWTFPYDRVRDVLIARVGAGGSASGSSKLTIGELGPDWLTGVSLTAVTLERTAALPDEAPSRLALDELTLHAAPLTFLFGGVGIDFDASVGQGEIEGNYRGERSGPPHQFASTLDSVDLARLGLGSFLGIPMRGTADGMIEVQLAEKPADTHGAIDMQIEQLRLGDGKAKIKVPGMGGGLTLDPIDAGATQIKLIIRDGVATVERLEAKGKDLQMTGSGSVRLATALPQSRIDLTLEVKFDKGYTQRSERTKIAFELMEASPVIKRATSADGTMRFRVSGTLAAPRASPASPGSKP